MGESDPQMRTEMPLPEEGIGDGAKGAPGKMSPSRGLIRVQRSPTPRSFGFLWKNHEHMNSEMCNCFSQFSMSKLRPRVRLTHTKQ